MTRRDAEPAPTTERAAVTSAPGRVDALFLKTAHGAPVVPAAEVAAESGRGLVGDVSFGRSKRQVLLIEAETLEAMGLAPGDVKENVTLRGLPIAGAAPGRLIAVGEVVLEVTMDCAPCGFMDTLKPGLQEASEGRRGTLCRVVRGGAIRTGDAARWQQ